MSIANDIVRLAALRGYRVDEDGNVIGPRGILRTRNDTSGYPTIPIRADGYAGHDRYVRRIRVSRLVAYLKYGEAALAIGIETRHLDTDCTNNRPSNIAIGTHSDNEMDRPPKERSARAGNAVSHRKWRPVNKVVLIRFVGAPQTETFGL